MGDVDLKKKKQIFVGVFREFICTLCDETYSTDVDAGLIAVRTRISSKTKFGVLQIEFNQANDACSSHTEYDQNTN